ncbi:MMPL family transporter [Bacillus mangrovi]|uniref:MMPL family transporter n=1 Tax=Metabacillus mangrovi TaxID=1491830 RepID=A0A7X2V5E0_9BACI|nr:efflux RND transporter permease subunit [Metabacillus mangrovi]MTH54074.1 MMPL family transporter [Metabacillus mangrovi]
MEISKFFIKRPIFTLVTMVFVLILGGVSFIGIPLKLIPELNPPVGVVVTSYQGAGPNEIMEKVGKPLEESLSTLEGLDRITSTSEENSNLILLQFSWTTNIEDLENEIIERMTAAPLPDGADKPRFLKFDPAQFPVIQLSLSSENAESRELQALSEDLEEELSKIEGVASVNLTGTLTDEVAVELDQDKLKEYGLSQEDLVNVIRANSVSSPGDPIVTEGRELTARTLSVIDSVELLENLPITKSPETGEDVLLKDAAKVSLKQKEQETITRENQKPSLLLSVLQQSDANTAAVSAQFQEELKQLLKNDKYKDIRSDVIFDQGEYIDRAIGNMLSTLLIGGALAMVILFLFLRNIKSPLIIGIAIPYSVIVTFVLMYFSKFTLNIMTLGGLALGIGMLVDNSIVVIENIYRHLAMGKPPKKAAYEGAKEVGPAIIASTLTTIAVFVPVVFITGLIGDLFKEFSLTIAFSLFASLVVALTVVPMLASRLLTKPPRVTEEIRRQSSFMRGYERAIAWCLSRRFLVLAIAGVLFAGSIYGLTKIGAVFLPNSDEGFFTIRTELEAGSSLEETEKTVDAIEKYLAKENAVDVTVSLIGTTQEESFRGTNSSNIAETYVRLKEKQDRSVTTFELIDQVKEAVEKEAANSNSTAKLRFNLQSTTGSTPNTLSFNVRDSEKNRLDKTVEKMEKAIEELPEVNAVETDLNTMTDELQINVDRKKAFDQGLTPAQIGMAVETATRGTNALQLDNKEDEELYDVTVRYSEGVTEDAGALENLLIKKPQGGFVELGDVSDISRGKTQASIQRIDKQDAVEFSILYKDTANLSEVSDKVDEEISSLNLPDETEITFSGDRELLEGSIDDMILALVLAIIFVYIVMAAQFESFKYPFVIMFTIPLMAIGVAAALLLTNTAISLSSVIGIIVLAGIVVNNAIVIVEYINQRKEMGMPLKEALIEASSVRLRPILMTALTTILGLLPLAFGIGEGTEINRPMGITVIGGLITSTLLTLFVIPVVYSLFDGGKKERA